MVTRYCHLLTPTGRRRQAVTAGQVIGAVGTSGHCSGPHPPYEVHVATDGSHDHSAASAVDPVRWQAAVNAPLGA